MRIAKIIGIWTLQVLMGVLFGGAGISKLLSQPGWVRMFQRIGFSEHFYLVIGAVEAVAAVALLVPRLAGYAACVLIVVMGGAVFTHLRLDEPRRALATAVYALLLAAIAHARLRGFLSPRVRRETFTVS